MFLFPVRARQKWTKKRGKKNRCSLDRQVFFVYEFPKFFTNTMKSNRLQKIFLFSLILFNFKALKSSPQHPTAYHLVFLSRHPPIRPLKHSQIKGFFSSENTKLFCPLFFSSSKKRKKNDSPHLSFPPCSFYEKNRLGHCLFRLFMLHFISPQRLQTKTQDVPEAHSTLFPKLRFRLPLLSAFAIFS